MKAAGGQERSKVVLVLVLVLEIQIVRRPTTIEDENEGENDYEKLLRARLYGGSDFRKRRRREGCAWLGAAATISGSENG